MSQGEVQGPTAKNRFNVYATYHIMLPFSSQIVIMFYLCMNGVCVRACVCGVRVCVACVWRVCVACGVCVCRGVCVISF